MSSSKKILANTGASTEPVSGSTRKATGSTHARRIAELENRLADVQLQLAAASGKLESTSAELQTSSAKLRDSQETTRSTLDALKASLDREKLALAFAEIGTCEFNVKGSMVRSSEMSLRLFGIRSDQTEMAYEKFLDYLHPEDRAKFSQAIERQDDVNLVAVHQIDVVIRILV